MKSELSDGLREQGKDWILPGIPVLQCKWGSRGSEKTEGLSFRVWELEDEQFLVIMKCKMLD